MTGPQTFPVTAADTTRENPWPVRALAQRMSDYISRAPAAWIEGQIAEVAHRANTTFLVLRDPAAPMSLSVSCPTTLIRGLSAAPVQGDRIVMHGRFDFFPGRGSLTFRADALHQVGIGELLARLERLRRLLHAEGLTDPRRKRRLPFLPRTIGLITGKASAAEADVLTNARAQWPAAHFRVINTPVQGNGTVTQVLEALGRLDADPAVEVIVIARGGGSLEDLLPFSDETLCRAVAACRTPVVSAIGHEPDRPLLDDVADLRCSTPTDAGKRVVPDARAEEALVRGLQHRARRALSGWVDTQQARVASLHSRPAMTDPYRAIDQRSADVQHLRATATRVLETALHRHTVDLQHRRAQLSVLGPAATLARGYAVVQVEGRVMTSVDEAPAGVQLRIRVADGAVLATSAGPESP